MEAVLKNSINSTINSSQVSNISTARLLIDHIKRVVEDDMKSTVEAFQLIESEIEDELKSTVSTKPKKTFDGNRLSRSKSFASSPQSKKADKRNSLQPNYRVPSAASSKRNMRKSLISTPILDGYFESDNTIEENSNYGGYGSPHSQQAKLYSENYQEFESIPEAASTPVKNPFSFPSIGENLSVPSCEQSESTITNPYNYQNDYQRYSDNSKLLTVEAMYQDLKADLNRIFQRFAQESNEAHSPTRTAKNYHDPSHSLYCDQTSQTSVGTSRRSSVANDRYGRGIVLPQLLAFGDNWNNNRRNDYGKGLTIISEPFSQPDRGDRVVDEKTKNMNEKLSHLNSWGNGFESRTEERGTANPSGNKITGQADPVHRISSGNSNDTPQKPTDSEGEYMNTVDLNVLPQNVTNGTNNYVTLTDIDESIPETTRDDDDDGLTSICTESKITDNISTSLIVTPKTVKESSNDCTNLDEIAWLISQAAPNRRVVIKKKVPDVAVKGYNRNCDEKLIFSGDKVTHVKTDRKIICRNYDPK